MIIFGFQTSKLTVATAFVAVVCLMCDVALAQDRFGWCDGRSNTAACRDGTVDPSVEDPAKVNASVPRGLAIEGGLRDVVFFTTRQVDWTALGAAGKVMDRAFSTVRAQAATYLRARVSIPVARATSPAASIPPLQVPIFIAPRDKSQLADVAELKSEVAAQAARINAMDSIVYVHGYSMEMNRAVASGIKKVYASIDRLALVFGLWPTTNSSTDVLPGNPAESDLLTVARARNSVVNATAFGDTVLPVLSEVSSIANVRAHAIFYSMGSRALNSRPAGPGSNRSGIPKLATLTLCAPEIPRSEFERVHADWASTAQSLRIYCVERDETLLGAAVTTTGGVKLGQCAEVPSYDRWETIVVRPVAGTPRPGPGGNPFASSLTTHDHCERYPEVAADVAQHLSVRFPAGTPTADTGQRQHVSRNALHWVLAVRPN